MTNEEVVEEVCKVFEFGEASWSFENYNKTTSVMFYLSCVRGVEQNPFQDKSVHRLVIEFLEKKLDEAIGTLASETMRRAKVVAGET